MLLIIIHIIINSNHLIRKQKLRKNIIYKTLTVLSQSRRGMSSWKIVKWFNFWLFWAAQLKSEAHKKLIFDTTDFLILENSADRTFIFSRSSWRKFFSVCTIRSFVCICSFKSPLKAWSSLCMASYSSKETVFVEALAASECETSGCFGLVLILLPSWMIRFCCNGFLTSGYLPTGDESFPGVSNSWNSDSRPTPQQESSSAIDWFVAFAGWSGWRDGGLLVGPLTLLAVMWASFDEDFMKSNPSIPSLRDGAVNTNVDWNSLLPLIQYDFLIVIQYEIFYIICLNKFKDILFKLFKLKPFWRWGSLFLWLIAWNFGLWSALTFGWGGTFGLDDATETQIASSYNQVFKSLK